MPSLYEAHAELISTTLTAQAAGFAFGRCIDKLIVKSVDPDCTAPVNVGDVLLRIEGKTPMERSGINPADRKKSVRGIMSMIDDLPDPLHLIFGRRANSE